MSLCVSSGKRQWKMWTVDSGCWKRDRIKSARRKSFSFSFFCVIFKLRAVNRQTNEGARFIRRMRERKHHQSHGGGGFIVTVTELHKAHLYFVPVIAVDVVVDAVFVSFCFKSMMMMLHVQTSTSFWTRLFGRQRPSKEKKNENRHGTMMPDHWREPSKEHTIENEKQPH